MSSFIINPYRLATPYPIPGDFYYWLDADDATNGGTTWTSKDGKVFTSATITKTTNAINGLPVINGSNHHYDTGGITMTSGNTVFVVGRFTGNAQFQRVISEAALNTNDFQTAGGTISLYTPDGSTIGTLQINVGGVSPVSYTTNTDTLWVSRRNNTSVTNYSYPDGKFNSVGATQTTNSVTATFDRVAVGKIPYSGSSPWDGQVAEVIYYTRYLSNEEFEQVRDYLITKYAIEEAVSVTEEATETLSGSVAISNLVYDDVPFTNQTETLSGSVAISDLVYTDAPNANETETLSGSVAISDLIYEDE
jgi:hypothetical protein